MLDFFRKVASSIPAEGSPPASQDGEVPIEPLMGAPREDSSKRAGIIVLREDLDFYVIPPQSRYSTTRDDRGKESRGSRAAEAGRHLFWVEAQ